MFPESVRGSLIFREIFSLSHMGIASKAGESSKIMKNHPLNSIVVLHSWTEIATYMSNMTNNFKSTVEMNNVA